MPNYIQASLAALNDFLASKGWRILQQTDIPYGRQVLVTDGTHRLTVSFYQTGRIVPQGKPSDLKTAISDWANLLKTDLTANITPITLEQRQNRIAKYLVIPDNLEKLRRVILDLPDETLEKDQLGPAEIYRIEVRQSDQRLTITQYSSGTLIIQGLSSPLFDQVCETLDEHLTQSFSDHASRFIPGEAQRASVSSYLESPEAENESTKWLLERIDRSILSFLHPNDRRTILAAAGVRNAIKQTSQVLPEYSVVVMPFAKAFEGFLIQLAQHIGLADPELLARKASFIEIGAWLELIKARMPDPKRYSETSDALSAAWSCRHKTIHSDFAHPLSVLASSQEADDEIATILRAMSRAHRVFVEEGILLLPPPATQHSGKSGAASEGENTYKFYEVNRQSLVAQLSLDGHEVSIQAEGRKNEWEIVNGQTLMVIAPRHQEGVVIVKGTQALEFCTKYELLLHGTRDTADSALTEAWIGADESGKGDVFGPLVVAGVNMHPDAEKQLARSGVRDSKKLSDLQATALAAIVRELCDVEVIVLLPPEYNVAYDRHGRNLNRLLAWGHARVISQLSRRRPAARAISDKFGDETLVKEALNIEGCSIPLEQRPRAESDMAVAAASVVARAEFLAAMTDYTSKAGIEIPLGASASQVKEIAIQIYKRWGKHGLERIAKMHFKTIQDILH